MITDPTTVITVEEVEEGEERVILEDSMRMEHVTVDPMDVVAVEETLVVEEEATLETSPSVGGVEEAVILQVEDERLKEQPVEIHIEQVTVTETADSEVQHEDVDSLNVKVEIENV